MVEEVVALRTEDQPELFVESLRFLEYNVCVRKSSAGKRIATDRYTLAKGGIGKGSGGRTNNFARSDDRSTPRRKRWSDQLRTIVESSVQVIDSPAEIEGKPGLHLLDARDLHAFEDMAEEAVVEVCSTNTDR